MAKTACGLGLQAPARTAGKGTQTQEIRPISGEENRGNSESWAGRRHSLQLEGKTVTSKERTSTNFEELGPDWPSTGF